MRKVIVLSSLGLGLTLILGYLFRNLGVYEWHYDAKLFIALIIPLILVSTLVIMRHQWSRVLSLVLVAIIILSNSVFAGYMISTYDLGHILVAGGVALAIFIGLTVSPGITAQDLTKPAIGALLLLLADLVALIANSFLNFDEDSFILALGAVALTLVLSVYNVRNVKLAVVDFSSTSLSEDLTWTAALFMYVQLTLVFVVILFVNGHS